MPEISIIGSGNVGANTAFFIAEQNTANVALFDVREGLARGKALDMMEAAPIRRYQGRLDAEDTLSGVSGSEIIVVAAGKVREPGMKRDDLFKANYPIIVEMAPQIAKLAPAAKVLIATEPVDLITTVFARRAAMPRTQVMGVGGFLDATRLRYLIAKELAVSAETVSALVIGRHSPSMVALPDYCNVSGVPLTQLLSRERIQALIEETREAGDLIVSMAQRSSAYYAPSAAVAEMVNAIYRDLGRVIPVSLVLNGEYGLSGIAMSLPAIIGRSGVVRVLEPRLTPQDRERLERAAEEEREWLEEVAA